MMMVSPDDDHSSSSSSFDLSHRKLKQQPCQPPPKHSRTTVETTSPIANNGNNKHNVLLLNKRRNWFASTVTEATIANDNDTIDINNSFENIHNHIHNNHAKRHHNTNQSSGNIHTYNNNNSHNNNGNRVMWIFIFISFGIILLIKDRNNNDENNYSYNYNNINIIDSFIINLRTSDQQQQPSTIPATTTTLNNDTNNMEYDEYVNQYDQKLSQHSYQQHNDDKVNEEDASSTSYEQIVQTYYDRIRRRPTNLRLVFMGDSITRYQYLSLTYFLKHGYWYDHSTNHENNNYNNLFNAHSFHHPFHPEEDWNEFFMQSNRLLHPYEACDCIRTKDGSIIVERRYFYDKRHNNIITYINMNGHTPATSITNHQQPPQQHQSSKYYGRFPSHDIYSNFENYVGIPYDGTTNVTYNDMTWQYDTWGQVIKYHIDPLFDFEIIYDSNDNTNDDFDNDDTTNDQENVESAQEDAFIVDYENAVLEENGDEDVDEHVRQLDAITNRMHDKEDQDDYDTRQKQQRQQPVRRLRRSDDGLTKKMNDYDKKKNLLSFTSKQRKKKHTIQPNNVTIILNAGLHPHVFGDVDGDGWVLSNEIKQAFDDDSTWMNYTAIWKTTTYSYDEVLAIATAASTVDNETFVNSNERYFQHFNTYDDNNVATATTKQVGPKIRSTDIAMCQLLGRCFNISWTAYVRPSLYFDNYHFAEPIYRILNEELLLQLNLLPTNYGPVMNRSNVMI